MREERQTKLTQVIQSIKDIDKNQGGLTLSLGKLEQEIAEAEQEAKQKPEKTERAKAEEKVLLKRRRQELIEEQIDTLELERRNLIQVKEELEKEAANDLGLLEDELLKLEETWQRYPFARRRALLNFLIREVVIDPISTHWIRVQVLWLHEEWGREEIYYQRRKGKSSAWTEEEIELVRTHYATTPKWELMKLLPERGWWGIRGCGRMLKIERVTGRISNEEKESVTDCLMPFPGDKVSSYSDLVFLYSRGLTPTVSRTKWERVFQYALAI